MSATTFVSGRVALHAGDCLDVLRTLPAASVDSCVTDPPYALVSIGKRFGKPGSAPAKTPEGGTGAYARASAGFMGMAWDTGEQAFAVELWAEVLRVLKPGGHVLAFVGTRTVHRLTCAIEDAGFEIRDQVGWAYGSGFPKSHDVSKGIDKAAGAEREVVGQKRNNKGDGGCQTYAALGEFRQSKFSDVTIPATDEAARWSGWGTALKPAWEPIVLARKPLIGTVAQNVLAHGTGALNIDGCRVGQGQERKTLTGGMGRKANPVYGQFASGETEQLITTSGRWPANIVHDGSDEVLAAFPESKAGVQTKPRGSDGIWSGVSNDPCGPQYGDSGSATRFFYSAKADADDRIGSKHPTVKPVDLMRWLVRLVTPPGGRVLDPFAGTGTTAEAAYREGMRAVLIEREAEYQADIARRMELVLAGPDERRNALTRARGKMAAAGPLFAVDAAE